MIGITTGLRFLSQGGAPVSGGGITVPDDPADPGGGDPGGPTAPTLASLPLAPAARWHPGFSTVTLDGDKVLAATDLAGLADLSADLATAPRAMTDGLGQKFWRFDGAQLLTVANTLTLSSRNMAVFFVGRFHRVTIKSAVFSLGSQAAGTGVNTVSAMIDARRNLNGMPMLQAGGFPSMSNYPNPNMMVLGSQMQVVGMAGRPSAGGLGGTGVWLNDAHQNTSQPYERTGIAGAEIGRYPFAPGASGAWGVFDLYELIVYDTSLTDAEGDALSATLMSHYSIPPVTNQLVLEGDSIMQGTGEVTPALSPAMILTEPGAGHIGADWRVVNLATSGNEMPDLVTRRDTTLGWPALTVPGENVLAFEMGRNDLSTSFGGTPATLYASVVDYLTNDVAGTTDNIFDHGWDVRVMANIASGGAFEDDFADYRALLRNPSFASDLGTQSGGPYAGRMQIIDTETITVGGDPVFATTADAQDLTYYAGDSTHPTYAGAVARMTGGDDPAKGVAFGL
ncbi:MAG: hypothetical protein AAFQ39_12435 [Pseudomonadota bacterium]